MRPAFPVYNSGTKLCSQGIACDVCRGEWNWRLLAHVFFMAITHYP